MKSLYLEVKVLKSGEDTPQDGLNSKRVHGETVTEQRPPC